MEFNEELYVARGLPRGKIVRVDTIARQTYEQVKNGQFDESFRTENPHLGLVLDYRKEIIRKSRKLDNIKLENALNMGGREFIIGASLAHEGLVYCVKNNRNASFSEASGLPILDEFDGKKVKGDYIKEVRWNGNSNFVTESLFNKDPDISHIISGMGAKKMNEVSGSYVDVKNILIEMGNLGAEAIYDLLRRYNLELRK